MPPKKEREKKKPKTFTNPEELHRLCNDIVTGVRKICKGQTNKAVLIFLEHDFINNLEYMKEHYYNTNRIRKECQKDLYDFTIKLHKLILKYFNAPNAEMKITIGIFMETFNSVLIRCYIPEQHQTINKPYKDRINDLLWHLNFVLIDIIKKDTGINIKDIGNDASKVVANLRKFLLNQKSREYSSNELTNIFGTIFSNMSRFSDLFVEKLSGDYPDIAAYINKLLLLWERNLPKKFNPNIPHIDRNTIGYVGLIVLKRIMLTALLIVEEQPQLCLGYMKNLKPSFDELDMMLKKALLIQTKLYTPLMLKLRSQLEKKKRVSGQGHMYSGLQPNQQQIRQWQQRLTAFVQDLDRQQQQRTRSLQRKTTMATTSLPQTDVATNRQCLQRLTLQQKQQPTKTWKPEFAYQYRSPHYRHRNDFRVSTQENESLNQRKNMNIPQVQSSIIDQSLPVRVMEIAIQGGYSSILLIDVANKHKQLFPEQHQQKVVSAVKKIIPWDVPQTARKKPLYVFIEQGELDASLTPKATIDDRLLKNKNILQVKVSCVKETKSGARIDCYKKQQRHQQHFTKNPMDDFVLLTLKHALRSYYHQYMKHMGCDIKMLKKLETLEDIISQNPYEILFQQQDIGGLVQHTYKNIKFDELVPYTWAISDDRWRDWMREKR